MSQLDASRRDWTSGRRLRLTRSLKQTARWRWQGISDQEEQTCERTRAGTYAVGDVAADERDAAAAERAAQ